MTVVFVGGSRAARLNKDVRDRLDRIISQGHRVVVGDANGVDKAVQAHLAAREYRNVVVFCSGDIARNNVGDWDLHSVSVPGKKKDRRFYSVKDRVMAEKATHGLMIWDGESVGTLQNVLRLVQQGKPVVLFEVKGHRFSNLRSVGDWQAFSLDTASRAPAEAERAVREEAPEAQASLI